MRLKDQKSHKVAIPTPEEFAKLVGDPRGMIERKKSDGLDSVEKVRELWDDLNEVGKTKALGYLPFDALFILCGVQDLKALAQSYEARGLKTRLYFNPKDERDDIGFFFVWDQNMLQKMLNQNAKLLRDSRWPQNAARFVDHVHRVDAPEGPLYDFIAKTFNDKRYR